MTAEELADLNKELLPLDQCVTGDDDTGYTLCNLVRVKPVQQLRANAIAETRALLGYLIVSQRERIGIVPVSFRSVHGRTRPPHSCRLALRCGRIG
jgi:hypothetical protein